MRLAAKLLGWRIDIKSEEEKRQEVETAMAALSAPPGAPVAVLLDFGLTDDEVNGLVEAGVATVERIAAMTPEEITGQIPNSDASRIQQAVTDYYSQFDGAAAAAQESAAPEEKTESPEVPENVESSATISEPETGVEGQ